MVEAAVQLTHLPLNLTYPDLQVDIVIAGETPIAHVAAFASNPVVVPAEAGNVYAA